MKFLIIGPPRSGTTNLMSILNQYPNLGECCYEPFSKWNHSSPLRKKQLSVREGIDEVYRTHVGMKEVVESLDRNGRSYLFSQPIKIIVTYRWNLLRQAVSMYIANTTGKWQSADKPKRSISSLDETEIGRLLGFFHRCRKTLSNEVPPGHRMIVYEDFFLSPDEDYQVSELKSLFEFLELKPIVTTPMLNRLRNGRVLKTADYLSMDNVYKIERKYAGRNGSLLSGGLL